MKTKKRTQEQMDKLCLAFMKALLTERYYQGMESNFGLGVRYVFALRKLGYLGYRMENGAAWKGPIEVGQKEVEIIGDFLLTYEREKKAIRAKKQKEVSRPKYTFEGVLQYLMNDPKWVYSLKRVRRVKSLEEKLL